LAPKNPLAAENNFAAERSRYAEQRAAHLIAIGSISGILRGQKERAAPQNDKGENVSKTSKPSVLVPDIFASSDVT